jgi:glutaredoxin-like YruB-family protein
MNERVVVYSSPTCAPCKAAKEYLASKGVPFREVNVAEDAEARDELVRLTGQTMIPVILVGDEVVQGFNKPKLQSLLGL